MCAQRLLRVIATLSLLLSSPYVNDAMVQPTVDKAIESVLSTEDYEALLRESQRWRVEFSAGQKKSFVIALIPLLHSEEQLPLNLPDRTVILPQIDPAQGIPREFYSAQLRLRHDLRTVAGRATWAIEEILLCNLPPVTRATERPEVVAVAVQRILERMEWPSVDGTMQAGVEVRVAAARSADSPPRLLEELARDPSPDVRAAVASNSHTPYATVTLLLGDEEPAVKAAAEENHRRARSLEAPIPEQIPRR